MDCIESIFIIRFAEQINLHIMINKVHIERFRGFHNIEIELGSHLTVIAGQNGTQKTVLLGIITQPFSITDVDNPMKNESPLCGGNYKSQFSDKFKFSPKYDLAKSHEWTMYVDDLPPFTIESINRSKESNDLRFWRKGNRDKGSGYLQYPVIYLSLKRLFPIGEDSKICESNSVVLSQEEEAVFKELHKKILISFDKLDSPQYVESKDKNTLGVNAENYDWRLNSAGQDNLGKIILALLSFRRLKEKYPDDYKGGVLAIDELDSALYPASQIKLLHILRSYASRYNIQIVFTTHSIPLLEESCKLLDEVQSRVHTAGQIKVHFLEKKDNNIVLSNISSIESIKNRLNVSMGYKPIQKLSIYTEDSEGRLFVKALLNSKLKNKFVFHDIAIGCNELISLAKHKVPTFLAPYSLVVLDGDAHKDVNSMKWKTIGAQKNYFCMPGDVSPERLLADMLNNLSDYDDFWGNVGTDYTKQVCFRDYTYEEIVKDRLKAKQWFNSQLEYWGKTSVKAITKWKQLNAEAVKEFNSQIKEFYNSSAKIIGLSIVE